MENRLTFLKETLVSNQQKDKFAKSISGTLSEKVKQFDEFVYPAVLAVKKGYRKTSKLITRNQRVKDFLLKSLDSFSEEHAILYSLIENGEALHPSDKDVVYKNCKHRISVTIRATKRISKLVKKPSRMLELMNACIQERRTDKKYEIAY